MEKARKCVSNSSFKWRSTFLLRYKDESSCISSSCVALNIPNSEFTLLSKTLLPQGLINKGISHSNVLPDGFIEAHLQIGDMTGFSTKADTQIISSFHVPLLTLITQLLTPIPKISRQFHNLLLVVVCSVVAIFLPGFFFLLLSSP